MATAPGTLQLEGRQTVLSMRLHTLKDEGVRREKERRYSSFMDQIPGWVSLVIALVALVLSWKAYRQRERYNPQPKLIVEWKSRVDPLDCSPEMHSLGTTEMRQHGICGLMWIRAPQIPARAGITRSCWSREQAFWCRLHVLTG